MVNGAINNSIKDSFLTHKLNECNVKPLNKPNTLDTQRKSYVQRNFEIDSCLLFVLLIGSIVVSTKGYVPLGTNGRKRQVQ